MSIQNAIETLRQVYADSPSNKHSYDRIATIVAAIGKKYSRDEIRQIADEFLGVPAPAHYTKKENLRRIERRIAERKESWQRCQF